MFTYEVLRRPIDAREVPNIKVNPSIQSEDVVTRGEVEALETKIDTLINLSSQINEDINSLKQKVNAILAFSVPTEYQVEL